VARGLARPRGRRGSDPERERELKRLCLAVCDDTGFRLYSATYDQPKRRDELIERLSGKAEAEKVRVTRLDIAEAGPETSLVGLLRAYVHGADLPSGWRQAVMVVGIEQRLDYSSGREGAAFLHQANLLRDALPEAAPAPVVLWLSRLATSAIQREAPDLWDWRAASFDFTGDDAPRIELLRELTTWRTEDDDGGLSTEQRRARIDMLQDLLGELERDGPPKSKRQVAERAGLLAQVGKEHLIQGHTREAVPCFERALSLTLEIGIRPAEGAAHLVLGTAYFSLGEQQRGIEHLEQALVILREAGERRAEGEALRKLGDALRTLNEPKQAIKHYERALVIFRELGERQRESEVLSKLGEVCLKAGEARLAIGNLERALAIAHEIGNRKGEIAALLLLGKACFDLHEMRLAIDYFDQSLAIAREINSRPAQTQALAFLAAAYAAVGERRAIEYFDQALAIAREIGDRGGEGNVLNVGALAFELLGDRAEAIRRTEEALRLYEELKHPLREDVLARLEKWQVESSSTNGRGQGPSRQKRGAGA
jgi:tetratricopeptide (TPR) repeat protein